FASRPKGARGSPKPRAPPSSGSSPARSHARPQRARRVEEARIVDRNPVSGRAVRAILPIGAAGKAGLGAIGAVVVVEGVDEGIGIAVDRRRSLRAVVEQVAHLETEGEPERARRRPLEV